MKNYRKIICASLLGATVLGTTSCSDDFAELNSNPSQITTAEPTYLFAQSVMEFDPYPYTFWYYDAPMLYSWSQLGVPTNSFTETFKVTTITGGVGYVNVLKYVREIEYLRANMSTDDAAKYAAVESAMKTICNLVALAATDINGDTPYTEAANALHGGTLTPGYDRIADLYDLWLNDADEAINVFTTATNQTFPANQDVVFRGDLTKWAKLANSFKLKIASRLLSQNKSRALQIAEQVTSASCGYINTVSDAMLFNKAMVHSGNQDLIYHWSNGIMDGTAGSQRMIDFMVENRDPRVRFCYTKNDWNSKIVQEFYDQGRDIPHYIEENVEYTTDAAGNKTFVSWKGAGEPWVRYYGLPLEYNARQNAGQYGDWYDYSNRFRITDSNGQSAKTYQPYSMFQRQQIIGRYYNFTMPTVPGGPVIVKNDPRPWYGLYMGAGEVNLYLAEFKLLGANLPGSAESYYNQGLSESVKEYDTLAEKNQIAYYKATYDYDPNEVSIELRDGEIETMLANEGYKLTGSTADQLEKVYLQQMLNFTMYPYDQFITSRRSGIPKFGSSLVNREDYDLVPVTDIPRRFHTGVPNETSLMYEIETAAYQTQGYTMTAPGASNTSILNSERTWSDIGAPQWGAGPNQ